MKQNVTILGKNEWLDALVSRKINFQFNAYGQIKNKPQANIGPRVIREHHLSFFERGGSRCLIQDKVHLMQASELLWLSPGTLHHFNPDRIGVTHSVSWLRFFLGKNEKPFVLNWPFIKTDQLHGIPGMYSEILHLIAFNDTTSIFRARCLLANMLAYVLENVPSEKSLVIGMTERQKRHCLEYINQNIRKRPGTGQIAAAIGLSEDYFSRLFTKTFQIPVQTFMKQERVRFAGQLLLESDRTIAETAYEMGYTDIYLFSHQFKEVAGLSPRAWRESKIVPRK